MAGITKLGIGVARRAAVALVALVLLAPLMPAPAVRAAPIQYVGTTADDAGAATNCTSPVLACTLRDALNAAAAGAVVALPPGNVNTFAVTLTQGQLAIGRDVTIQGGGLLTVDGGGTGRVFQINGGAVAMDGVTIQNGLASDAGAGIEELGGSLTLADCLVTNNLAFSATGSARGGGIYAQSDLTLIGTTVSHNDVASSATTGGVIVFGGGIASYAGTLTITGSTIAANETHNPTNPAAVAQGAGIYTQGTLALTNSTVSDNVGLGQIQGNQGIGIIVTGGTATITGSTIARNGGAAFDGGILDQSTSPLALVDTLVAGNALPDLDSYAVITGRNNLIEDGTGSLDPANGNLRDDPALDPAGLQANGPTGPQTIALLRTSPAIEAGGNCPNGVATDQRGLPRVGACDIGAYEFQPAAPAVADATAPASGGAVTFRGTGFQVGTQLTLGATALTDTGANVSADGTQMTLSVPAHSAGGVAFAVSNPGGGHIAPGTLTYHPVATGLSPGSGSTAGGGTVTITGVGFAAGATGVSFGATPATVTGVTATTATVTVPAHDAGTVTVTVNGAAGTMPGGYIYGAVAALPPPAPTAAPVGGGPLPAPRPAGAPVGGSPPSPLPPARP